MAVIMPEVGGGKKFDRDPNEGNIPTGTYLMRLTRIQEIPPSAKYPDSGNRLVFEFEVAEEGPQKGKKACSFVGKKLWANPAQKKESALVKLARQLGCPDPMKTGFDPEGCLGKHYTVTCELDGDRAWVRFVAPAAAVPAPSRPDTTQAHAAISNGVAAASPPPPRRPGAPANPPPQSTPQLFYIDMGNGADPVTLTKDQLVSECKNFAHDPNQLQVCPVGGAEWRTLIDLFPESKDWSAF